MEQALELLEESELLEKSELLERLEDDGAIELLDLLDEDGVIDELLEALVATELLLRELLDRLELDDELIAPAESP